MLTIAAFAYSPAIATVDPLACPLSKTALRFEQSVLGGVRRSRLTSTSTGAQYPITEVYYDLLPSASRAIGVKELQSELLDAWNSRMQTQFFRTPAMAFLYERGWRQNFNYAGFPGIDKEFEEVTEFFAPADGGTVVDLSCGSGLMSRRLCKSGRYARVLGLDYSEAMLRETSRRFDDEKVLHHQPPPRPTTLRAAQSPRWPYRTLRPRPARRRRGTRVPVSEVGVAAGTSRATDALPRRRRRAAAAERRGGRAARRRRGGGP